MGLELSTFVAKGNCNDHYAILEDPTQARFLGMVFKISLCNIINAECQTQTVTFSKNLVWLSHHGTPNLVSSKQKLLPQDYRVGSICGNYTKVQVDD